MPHLPPPPRLRVRGQPPALVVPALRDIPDFDGEEIEEGPAVEVEPVDESELDAERDRAGRLALQDGRVRDLVAGRDHVVCGTAVRFAKRGDRPSFLTVVHTYDDALTHEITVRHSNGGLAVIDIASLDYQPAPTDGEIELAISIARSEGNVAALLGDNFEAQALLLSAVEPGDEHYHTRRFSVVFGPPDERLPHVNAVVDLVTREVLSFHHNRGGSR